MSVSTNDLKNGMTLDIPGDGLFSVVEFQHVKPGKGGAFVRTKLKNVRTGAVIERTYRADEKLEQAIIDKREMQYLYRDGDDYVFMDNTTYDQMHVEPASLGDAAGYLKEGDSAVLQMYGTEIVGVDLPGCGRAHGHRHRARGAGRPRQRRPQAGHPRDRPRRAGASVRQHRRPHQGRHPLGRVPHPGVTTCTRRAMAVGNRRQARERALSLLYEADAKGVLPSVVLADLPGRARDRSWSTW